MKRTVFTLLLLLLSLTRSGGTAAGRRENRPTVRAAANASRTGGATPDQRRRAQDGRGEDRDRGHRREGQGVAVRLRHLARGARRLKEAGVPDALLLLMVMSPKCAPQPARRVAVRVPAGTPVELETAYTIDSQLVRAGDAVSFRVVNPVVLDGQVVIEQGAAATAVVTKAERGGHFGRAGRIAWTMKEVTAADGSRIPVEFSGRVVGDSKGGKVATRMILTGTFFWFAPPVALLHGFKRGANAIVPEGKRFDASVSGATTVNVTSRQ